MYNMNATGIEGKAATGGCHTLLTAIPAEHQTSKVSCITCMTAKICVVIVEVMCRMVPSLGMKHVLQAALQGRPLMMMQQLISDLQPHAVLPRFNHEAFKYLLAQTAAEALMKLGIRASGSSYVLDMPPMVM